MASEQLTSLATVSERAKQLVDGSINLVASSLQLLLDRYRYQPAMCWFVLVKVKELILITSKQAEVETLCKVFQQINPTDGRVLLLHARCSSLLQIPRSHFTSNSFWHE